MPDRKDFISIDIPASETPPTEVITSIINQPGHAKPDEIITISGIKLTYIQKVIIEEGYRFFYIRGIAKDKKAAWYFALIKPTKATEFENLDKNSSYNLSEYGDVIFSGYGEIAPDEIIERINIDFKCSFSN